MIRLYPGIRPLRTGVVHFSTKQAIRSSLWTIPNVLTYTRIITTPFIGYYITTGQSTAALLLFTYSCVTDFVDGYIARKYNMKSIVGSIVDPLADKLLMTVCTVSLGVCSCDSSGDSKHNNWPRCDVEFYVVLL